MTAEIPVIATNVGGIPEMIANQENGLLIQPKNSHELAEKINYLINNPKIAKKITQKARQKVEKEFTLERMIQETKKTYLK